MAVGLCSCSSLLDLTVKWLIKSVPFFNKERLGLRVMYLPARQTSSDQNIAAPQGFAPSRQAAAALMKMMVELAPAG